MPDCICGHMKNARPIKDEINQRTGSQDLGEFADHSEKWYFQITAMIISHFWLDVKADQWSFALLAGYSG